LKQTLGEEIAEGEWAEPGGETIAGIVALVVAGFDPMLDTLETVANTVVHPEGRSGLTTNYSKNSKSRRPVRRTAQSGAESR
jgi:hypothetical protein